MQRLSRCKERWARSSEPRPIRGEGPDIRGYVVSRGKIRVFTKADGFESAPNTAQVVIILRWCCGKPNRGKSSM